MKQSRIEREILEFLLTDYEQPFACSYADGTIFMVNNAYCELTGYSRKELLSTVSWHDLTPRDDLERELALLKQLKPNQSICYEKQCYKKNGTIIPVEIILHMETDPAGKSPYFYVFPRDISERKQLQELNIRKQELENTVEEQTVVITDILERITDGFFSINNDWKFDYLNKEAEKFFQTPRAELLGKSWFETIYNAEIYEEYQKALKTQQAVHFESKGKFTAKWAEVHVYPSAKGLSVFFRDITEKKKYEEEIARLSRLDIIGQMAAGVAHEIRNPLTVIKGYLQFLQPKIPCDFKEQINCILDELGVVETIISDFLSLARNSVPGERMPIHLQTILSDLYPLIHADALKHNVDVNLNVQQNLPQITGNQKELKQLVLNLCRNAIEAIAEHGNLSIHTGLCGNKVRLSIQDNGCGIPKARLEQIFTPFYSTKERGTGLGLAICANIAESHGASIAVDSQEGIGTTFHVTFSAADS